MSSRRGGASTPNPHSNPNPHPNPNPEQGYVHRAEFPALIARLGQRVTAHEMEQMVQAMDREGTGKIHYQDYLSMASASVEDQRRHFPSDTVIFREGDT